MKSNVNCWFGTVIYKNAFRFLPDFAKSLKYQDTDDFKILIVNDDCGIDEIQMIMDCFFPKERFEIINTSNLYKPYELRVLLIQQAKDNGGDLLILGDCDDWFSNNRVSSCMKAYTEYKEYDIFYNELRKADGSMVMSELPNFTERIDDILESNYLGLSNTSIRLSKLDERFISSLREGKTMVFDWYLYSRLLLLGLKAKKVNEGYTYYRIHENNFAGEPLQNDDAIEKERRIKEEHYSLLIQHGDFFRDLKDDYSEANKNHLEINNNGKKYWWNTLRRNKQNEV